MTTQDNLIRFGEFGPDDTGLQEWERMDPAALVAGEPVQRGHIYHELPEAGYLCGVWDCTAFTEHMGPYGVDEFMLLLDGMLIMHLPDGTKVEVNKGDAFIIPKGFECQWEQPGYVRKVFMILDGPVPDSAASPSLTRITVPDLAADLPLSGGVTATRADFVNAAGTMQVALRACAAARIPALPVPDNRLIHVLSGSLTLTCEGETATFAQGETAYLRQGSHVDWNSDAGTKLLEASYCAG